MTPTPDRKWRDAKWSPLFLIWEKVQRRRLDFEYLKEWAAHLEVEDLLRKAYEDAGLDPALA